METFPKATTYRPLIHITPKKGWINDPNGFVFFKNEYHIYTQNNPYDTKWGPMHWLHFKSKDLINWEECGVALKPDKPYDKEFGCFSGSIVVNDNKMFVYYRQAVTATNSCACMRTCNRKSRPQRTIFCSSPANQNPATSLWMTCRRRLTA